MNIKRESERELYKVREILRINPDHTEGELKAIGGNMPVRVMKDPKSLADYAVKNHFSIRDSMVIVNWTSTMWEYLNDIKVSNDISYDSSVEWFERVRTSTIIIHRVNYILHECMIGVYDTLEKENRLRFDVKKLSTDAERKWEKYISYRQRIIEKTAWYTLQDHLRIAYDTVSTLLEKVYESVRDLMIRKRLMDVEIKARCVVALLMGKVCGHSFRHLFKDFESQCGADYSRCFSQDDMQPMVKIFSSLCERLGLEVKADSDGFMESIIDPEESVRFNWAWKDFITSLRDDDLMDESAKKAIDLNPGVQREYSEILEAEEKKAMEMSIEQLGEKYKIGNL